MKSGVGRRVFALAGAVAVVALDQLTKTWWGLTPRAVIPGVVDFLPARNSGAAFSWLSNNATLITILSVAALLLLVIVLFRARLGAVGTLGVALMLGGAAGNLLDRVRLGYVVDFVRLLFMQFPVFNLADAALTIGVTLTAFAILTGGEGSH